MKNNDNRSESMLKKRITILSLFLIIMLLTAGCKDQSSTVYEKGFPKDSPALMEFMKYYFTDYNDKYLLRNDHTNVFSRGSNGQQDIQFYEYTDAQLKDYYQPLMKEKNPKKLLHDLKQSETLEKSLHHSVKNIEKYDLPSIKMKPDLQLNIKTKENEKKLDLPSLLREYGVKKTDETEINIEAVNQKSFALFIQDYSIEDPVNRTIGIFLTNDLQHIETTILNKDKLQQSVSSGKLKRFYDLFPKIASSERYLLLFDHMIVDQKTNQLIDIKKDDYLSNDGKYVYVNGSKDKLADGTQRIQTIEDYAEGKEKYDKQFDIDYQAIAKELGLKENGPSIAKVNYFGEDFVVLSLNYRGKLVGSAGFTNVMIDLSKKDNTANLVDLGIQSKIK